MNTFDGTLLPQNNEPREIQKGNLDLLAKINAVIDYVKGYFDSGFWPASRVSVVPSGNITSTDAQAALTELYIGKATVASPAFTGTPTIDAMPISSVSTSSTISLLTYPLGTLIPVSVTGIKSLNAAMTIYINSGGSGFQEAVNGTALDGTWRCSGICGQVTNIYQLFRRVS